MNRLALVAVPAAVLAFVAGTYLPAATAREQPPVAAAHSATSKIGTIDALAVIAALLPSEKFKPAREAFETEQRARLDKNKGEMEEIQKKYAALPDNSPERAALAQEFNGKRELEQQVQVAYEKFNTVQVADAYKLVLAAANAVAEQQGFTHVIATRTDPTLVRSENTSGAIQEILARPMLRAPSSDDITSAVMKELKVEAPKPPEATPAPAPAPVPATPPKPDR